MLKPQDIVVLLKIWLGSENWTYSELAKQLQMSSSEVHGAVKRCEESRLYHGKRRRVLTGALTEFLVHGVKYAFPSIGRFRQQWQMIRSFMSCSV